jgi:hemoglobin-like flavoprotein
MTPNQVKLVQTSFARVAPLRDTAAALFYRRLFEIAPEIKPLFGSNLREQGRKLMDTLGTVVKGLPNLDVAKSLAIKDVPNGVRPAHYRRVGEALIWMIEIALGDDFTPEMREAWLVTYRALSGAMIEEAYGEALA